MLQWMSHYDVNRTELAKRLGVGRAYISLLLIDRNQDENQKTKHFGEKSARSIEKKLGMPSNYLDDSQDVKLSCISDWDLVSNLPDIGYALVPQTGISVVDGELVSLHLDLPPLAFTKLWLTSKNVVSRASLRTMPVCDDSMIEYLQNGDITLVDTNQIQVQDRAIYAIRFADELRIKRLEKMFDGGLRIISDNPSRNTEELSPERAARLTVVGRVLWRAG